MRRKRYGLSTLAWDDRGVLVFLRCVDWLAHLLYEPAMLGRRCVAVPNWRNPLHRVHLIPGAWLERVCTAYDRRLGVTEDEMRRAA